MDIYKSIESGDKGLWKVEGLGYDVELPYVLLPQGEGMLRIASLNLVGQVRLNRDLGELLADRIKAEAKNGLEGLALLCVVEKALQLTQVVAEKLGLDQVAVAYNRVKPHMEPSTRPVIQIGVESVTSGGKILAVYERDIEILARAKTLIIVDDVVSTGGTLVGLLDLVHEVMAFKSQDPPDVLGVFCAASEGQVSMDVQVPVHSLGALPEPQFIKKP